MNSEVLFFSFLLSACVWVSMCLHRCVYVWAIVCCSFSIFQIPLHTHSQRHTHTYDIETFEKICSSIDTHLKREDLWCIFLLKAFSLFHLSPPVSSFLDFNKDTIITPLLIKTPCPKAPVRVFILSRGTPDLVDKISAGVHSQHRPSQRMIFDRVHFNITIFQPEV